MEQGLGASALPIPGAVLETARDELQGCLIRRSGQTCEVRKEYLQVALEAMARITSLQAWQAPTTPAINQGEAEIPRAHIADQIKHVENRIQDGKEMGATVWRIALEDIVRENTAVLASLSARSTAE